MCTTLLTIDVCLERISPGKHCDVAIDWEASLKAEDNSVKGLVFETICTPNATWTLNFAEQEEDHIEQVRAEIRKDPKSLVAPRGIPHIACRPVAIEKPSAIDQA
jgi:hypothetical protein